MGKPGVYVMEGTASDVFTVNVAVRFCAPVATVTVFAPRAAVGLILITAVRLVGLLIVTLLTVISGLPKLTVVPAAQLVNWPVS